MSIGMLWIVWAGIAALLFVCLEQSRHPRNEFLFGVIGLGGWVVVVLPSLAAYTVARLFV